MFSVVTGFPHCLVDSRECERASFILTRDPQVMLFPDKHVEPNNTLSMLIKTEQVSTHCMVNILVLYFSSSAFS